MTATAKGAVSHWNSRPASAGAGHLSDGFGGAQPGVGLGQPLAGDQARQVGVVGDVEQAAQPGHQRRGGEHLGEAQPAAPGGQRDAGQHHRARQVGGDQHPSPAAAVDEAAGGQPDQQGRRAGQRGEQAELPWGRAQAQHRHHGQAFAGDAGAEVGDRLRGPQPAEVALAPERKIARHGNPGRGAAPKDAEKAAARSRGRGSEGGRISIRPPRRPPGAVRLRTPF
ncbi:MAG TPA: hypothetical protein VHV27_07260 [Phenylobacterium sp.]|nr:hypothetical protein [Phenylobacterium sp.]